MIRKHALLPPETGEVDLETWPWPVVVRSLGGFELLLSGDLLQFSGKVPRRPLELLELLIVRGGNQVPEDWLADALWPDADGDAAAHSLSTTVLRLRQLLDVRGLLIRRNRCLSLDRRRCWVDAWALEEQLQALPSLEDVRSIVSTADRVLSIYRGSFMPHSALPATLGYRDRLLRRTVDILTGAAQRLEVKADFRRAAVLREKVRNLGDLVDPKT
jgi:two-component SAPR family response regulator